MELNVGRRRCCRQAPLVSAPRTIDLFHANPFEMVHDQIIFSHTVLTWTPFSEALLIVMLGFFLGASIFSSMQSHDAPTPFMTPSHKRRYVTAINGRHPRRDRFFGNVHAGCPRAGWFYAACDYWVAGVANRWFQDAAAMPI